MSLSLPLLTAVAVLGLLGIGLLGLLVTRNLIKVVVGMQVLVKGAMLALVLADLFPDKHDAIVAGARSIGWHRVQIARHYPTDIYAGRVLAQAIVKQMVKSDAFQKDFADAKAEIAAAQAAARN